MKTVRVYGVSLGSSSRDYAASVELAGIRFEICRLGTDGQVEKARTLIIKQAPKVDAIGLGGANLAYRLAGRCYPMKVGKLLAQAGGAVPVVDGFLVKSVWEPLLLKRLAADGVLDVASKRVLLSSALDRYPLAECLGQLGAKVYIGDALFALRLPLVFSSLRRFEAAARLTMPLLAAVPLKYLYPLGKKQEQRHRGRQGLLCKPEIIAGDFHLINRFLPADLTGKSIITSTLTAADRQELQRRRVKQLIPLGLTAGDRTFGANILEAMVCGAVRRQAFGNRTATEVLKILLNEYYLNKENQSEL